MRSVSSKKRAPRAPWRRALLHRRHPQLEAAVQVGAVYGELPSMSATRLGRPQHERQSLGGNRAVPLRERLADAERVGELQPEAVRRIERR